MRAEFPEQRDDGRCISLCGSSSRNRISSNVRRARYAHAIAGYAATLRRAPLVGSTGTYTALRASVRVLLCEHDPRVSTTPSTGVSTRASTAPSAWADRASTAEPAGHRHHRASSRSQANRSKRPIPREPRPHAALVRRPLGICPASLTHCPRYLGAPHRPSGLAATRPGEAAGESPPPYVQTRLAHRSGASRAAPAIRCFLALIYAPAIAAQPIQASANNRAPRPRRKPSDYSHGFSRYKSKRQPPIWLRFESRNRRPASHFAE